MASFEEITKSIKKMYYKRIDKNIDEDILNNWFYNLKEFWIKNKEITNFLEELHKENLEKKPLKLTGLITYCITMAKEYEERVILFGEEETLSVFLKKYKITEVEIKKFLKVKQILEIDN